MGFLAKGIGLFGWSGSSAGMSRGWFVIGKFGKSTSPDDASEYELITIAVLPSFFLELPFTLADIKLKLKT